jgi:hypothetical protein
MKITLTIFVITFVAVAYCADDELINVLLNKPATSSSSVHRGVAERGNDGNMDDVYNGESCTHTFSELNAWWQVDMEVERDIETVMIVNRGDCC